MSDFKVVYLIVERGLGSNQQTFWRVAGYAYVCRDGSLNLKLDIHPNLKFNIRDPKSNGERDDAEMSGTSNGSRSSVVPAVARQTGKHEREDDIPF